MRSVTDLRADRRAATLLAAASVALAVVLGLIVVLVLDDPAADRPGAGRPADPAAVAQALAASSYGTHEGGPLTAMSATYQQRTGANRKTWQWPLRKALNAWGNGTLRAGGPDRIDAVLRLERPAIYFQDADGRWTEVAESRPGLPALWSSTVTFPDGRWTQGAPFAWEHDAATDTWTIDLGQFPKGTYAHWAWESWAPRVVVPDDVRAVATAGYARLEGPDADSGHWLMGLSSDTFAAPQDSGSQHNVALQGPRFRSVTSSWQLYGITTQSAAELRASPPPVPAP